MRGLSATFHVAAQVERLLGGGEVLL